MSLQKLENYNNKEVIKEEVTILTDLLEEVTKNMLSPETFEKIIALKELAAAGNYEGLNEIVQSLSNKEMSYISRYFSILPLLINISEDVDLAFEINYQNNVGQDYLGKLSTTIDFSRVSIRFSPVIFITRISPVSGLFRSGRMHFKSTFVTSPL